MIDVGQLVQHEIADHFACYLCAPRALNSIFDVISNTLHALAADRSFDRDEADTCEQLLEVERLAVAVPFGDEQAGHNMLTGCEALLTVQALPAAAARLSPFA